MTTNDKIHSLRTTLAHQCAVAPCTVTRNPIDTSAAAELADEIVQARHQLHWAGSRKVNFHVRIKSVRAEIARAIALSDGDAQGFLGSI
jgi:hypothetical protein